MVRDLNQIYPFPLQSVFPPNRLGPALGDAPKVNCATCRNGVYEPLFGVRMAKNFPEPTGKPAATAPVQWWSAGAGRHAAADTQAGHQRGPRPRRENLAGLPAHKLAKINRGGLVRQNRGNPAASDDQLVAELASAWNS
jgi:hypothetical protein